MIKIIEEVHVSYGVDVEDYIQVDINGVPYKFIPNTNEYTVSELADKFNSIRKYSDGMALKWLKKRANGTKIEFDEEGVMLESEVKNPGILEVPDGKKVSDLSVSHFKNLIDKKGREAIIRAINNLSVWNKNKNKKLHDWAENMKKSLDGYGIK